MFTHFRFYRSLLGVLVCYTVVIHGEGEVFHHWDMGGASHNWFQCMASAVSRSLTYSCSNGNNISLNRTSFRLVYVWLHSGCTRVSVFDSVTNVLVLFRICSYVVIYLLLSRSLLINLSG